MTALDEPTGERPDRRDDGEGAHDLAAPDTRASGRWMAIGVPTARSEDFGGSVRRLARLLAPRRGALAVILVTAVAGATLNVIGPRLLGHATDTIIAGALGEGIDTGRLRHYLLQAGGLYLASAALSILTSYLLAGVVQRLMFDLRQRAEAKVHALPLSYIDQQARGDLLSRVTNDLDNLAQSLQQTLSQMLISVLLLVGVAVMMFSISPLLAVVTLTTVPVSIWAMRYVAKRARPRFIAQWTSTGALNAQVEETFTGHALVKAFGQQHEVEDRFRRTNDELFEASFGAQFMSSLMQPATMFLGNVQYVLVAVAGGLRVAGGAVTIGEVQAFILYARQFSFPLTQLASVMNIFQSGIASLERILELLDAEEQVPDAPAAPAPAPARGRVEFRDVSFSYARDRPLIEGLSLLAEPGQTVAIVGPTGAGKTTLVNLVMRFYEIDGGSITLDGRDITTIPRRHLRSNVGMVLQDTWLFGGTIRANIAYGNPAATEEQIMAAARATYVDRFVHSLPDGYDTVINEEGDNISAGQKQLLTIARAFLADPTILILDEATSSVDTRTEVLIQEAMSALRANRTSFVIAHRLSTIRHADTILVMEAGQIVEQGTHEVLVERGGAYARLYHSQFAGAMLDVDAGLT